MSNNQLSQVEKDVLQKRLDDIQAEKNRINALRSDAVSALGGMQRDWRKSLYTISFAFAGALAPLVITLGGVKISGHYLITAFGCFISAGVVLAYLDIRQIEHDQRGIYLFDKLSAISDAMKTNTFFYAGTGNSAFEVEFKRLEIVKHKEILQRMAMQLKETKVTVGNDFGLALVIFGVALLSRPLIHETGYYHAAMAMILISMDLFFSLDNRRASGDVEDARRIQKANMQEEQLYIDFLEGKPVRPIASSF